MQPEEFYETLNKLLLMDEDAAYIELSRLYTIMPETHWEQLCDEFAQSLAERNQLVRHWVIGA